MFYSLKKYYKYPIIQRFRYTFFWYSFFCFLVVFYANYKGLGLTYDSQNYLHASKTYTKKGIFLNKNNTPYTQQPPIFPIILQFFPKKNASIFATFQAFCLSFTVFIWLLMAKVFLDTKIFFGIYFHLFGLSLCFATPLYLVHHFVWSEPIFLLFLSLDLYFFMLFLAKKPFENKYENKEVNQKNGIYWLIFGMMICSFLYCLQRNTGIFFVFTKVLYFCLCGIWQQKNAFFYKKTNLYFIFFCGFVSVSGWVFWTFFAIKNNAKQSFLGHFSWNIDIIQMFCYNGKDLLKVFSTYFFPLSLVEKAGILLQIFVLGIGFLLAFFAKKTKFLVFVALIYTGFLLFFVPDFSDAERYLAVIYPIFLLVFYENVSKIFVWLHHKKTLLNQFFKILLVVFLVYFHTYHAVRTYKNVVFFRELKADWRSI